MRDSMSLTIYYGARVDFERSAVVAPSQSGQTPDVVEYVVQCEEAWGPHDRAHERPVVGARRRGRSRTAAGGRPEHAVAATKTYVNQLAALALLAGCAAGGRNGVVPGLGECDLRPANVICRGLQLCPLLANAFAYVGRMFVVGRGLEFATAREVAGQLKETCRIAAEPFTSTDLVMAPIAALDPLFPCGRSRRADDALPAVLEASARVRSAGAAIVASGNAAAEVEDAAYTLAVPEPPCRCSHRCCRCCPASSSPALARARA